MGTLDGMAVTEGSTEALVAAGDEAIGATEVATGAADEATGAAAPDPPTVKSTQDS